MLHTNFKIPCIVEDILAMKYLPIIIVIIIIMKS